MSSKNKMNNIVWSCSSKKNSEGFCNTIECGLPYIKACYNKNDKEIEIFNKMADELRALCTYKPVVDKLPNNN
jgi:hypothetical protein